MLFTLNPTYLYSTYVRGNAYLAAGRGKEAAIEFQKILDHGGVVWSCWTGPRLTWARLEPTRCKVGLRTEPMPMPPALVLGLLTTISSRSGKTRTPTSLF